MSNKTVLNYAIVDLETTGGRPDRDKITEIGIVLHNGREITDTYTTLINPGVNIPPIITRITGINQEMVNDAPFFHEVAKDIILRLEHSVFVAHNARFDYHFLRESFLDLGFTFTRPFLCTVKLSRQVFPGLPSYSLENLIKHFDIPVSRRHRALDDALATATILEKIFQQQTSEGFGKSSIRDIQRQKKLPVQLSPDILDRIPDECGVYYFRNKEGQVIYVGKSVHIRQRLSEHLQDISRKADRLDREIAEVDWIVTGSDLYAALFESYEIKRLQPSVNRAQRARLFDYGLTTVDTPSGYKRFVVERVPEDFPVIQRYSSNKSAQAALFGVVKRFQLCRHLTLEYQAGKPCFEFHVHECLGACVGQENAENYNQRFLLAASYLGQGLEGNFYLLDRGPTPDTKSVFAVEHGRFMGMGTVSMEGDTNYLDLEAAIKPYPDSPEVSRILRQFMAKNRYKRIEMTRDEQVRNDMNQAFSF